MSKKSAMTYEEAKRKEAARKGVSKERYEAERAAREQTKQAQLRKSQEYWAQESKRTGISPEKLERDTVRKFENAFRKRR